MTNKLSFSGHDSFQCRNLWLKKGYDFTMADQDFNDDRAVIDLGVGKNMVTAIRYWMRSFGLMDESGAVEAVAAQILDENGYDPFLEDIGTLWLLHHKLVTNEKASLYHLFFNEFRKKRIEFTKDQLKQFLVNECAIREESHSPNTIETDVGVFLKTYAPPKTSKGRNYIEDQYSSLLTELNLVREVDMEVGADSEEGAKQKYLVRNEFRESLPLDIFLYAILDNPLFETSESISIPKLLNGRNAPGVVFALDGDSLIELIEKLVEHRDDLVYKDDGGVRELQFRTKIDKDEVLRSYYNA